MSGPAAGLGLVPEYLCDRACLGIQVVATAVGERGVGCVGWQESMCAGACLGISCVHVCAFGKKTE